MRSCSEQCTKNDVRDLSLEFSTPPVPASRSKYVAGKPTTMQDTTKTKSSIFRLMVLYVASLSTSLTRKAGTNFSSSFVVIPIPKVLLCWYTFVISELPSKRNCNDLKGSFSRRNRTDIASIQTFYTSHYTTISLTSQRKTETLRKGDIPDWLSFSHVSLQCLSVHVVKGRRDA